MMDDFGLKGTKKILSGVDIFGGADGQEIVRFILDGVTFEAQEDLEDGYRSSVGDFVITKEKIKNTFPGVLVDISYQTNSPNFQGECDVLVLEKNGKSVLEVGMDNIDDYYPSWVCSYFPENLGLVK